MGCPNGPSPLTLLPAARSPSSRPYGTGLVGSCPTVSPLAPLGVGLFSVAVVVARELLRGRPHLLFHGAAFPLSRGWESGSSSPQTKIRGAAAHRQADGILTRWGGSVKTGAGCVVRGACCAQTDYAPRFTFHVSRFTLHASSRLSDLEQRIHVDQHDLAAAGADQAGAAEFAHHPDGGLDGSPSHVGHVLPRQWHLDHTPFG